MRKVENVGKHSAFWAFAIIAKCGKSKTSENIVLSGVRGASPEIPIILAFVSDFLG